MTARGDLRGRSVLAALICALAALFAPATASATPTAQASIVGGHAVTIADFPSLVYIEAAERKGVFSCTGTVVAPRIVLTAAHCVESIEKGTITRPSKYALTTSVADPRRAGKANTFHVVANHVFPGFDPGIVHGDAAILVLDRLTTAPPIPLAGAGAGGFVLFFVPPDRQRRVEAALVDHCLIRPHLAAPGSMVIFDGMDARAPMAERRRMIG